VEFGYVLEPSPRYTAKLAARVEAFGFDIMLCPDTQNLCADPYSQLALVGAATRRLRLGTGVTNPITRDAAVTASAVATLQVETGGRAICGLGRGDSSVAHIGRRSATTAELREYAEHVRAYLSGGVLRVGESDSRLRWVDPAKIPPAPIDIACTGPKTIEAAADVADRVSFAVGSAADRIRWALDVLRARLSATARNPSSLRIGAYVIVVCDRDERRAVGLARMISGLIAHFTAMKHAPVDHLPLRLQQLARQLRTAYDMARHNLASGAHLPLVDDDFVRWFAICGPPALCIDRLGELKAMGLDHLYVLNGSPIDEPHGLKWEAAVNELELFASHVMPALRR
jgi:5,10-methylenetetrahydromethanopterin reductase